MRRWLRRAAQAGLALLVLLVLAIGIARLALAEPRPEGAAGPEAEALAARIEAAVDLDAWARTGAVTFRVFGHRYLWDRERALVRFEDGRGVVLTEAWRPMGRAFRDGVEVGGDWKDRRVERAYRNFVNAAWWAFAPLKLHDEGAVRAVVDGPTGPALLVGYPTGGVTPGDAYRWEVGPDGLPVAFSLWTQRLPLPGARFTWEGWQTLSTGARVATRHRWGPLVLSITDLAGAPTLEQLAPGPDPFAPMFGP